MAATCLTEAAGETLLCTCIACFVCVFRGGRDVISKLQICYMQIHVCAHVCKLTKKGKSEEVWYSERFNKREQE